MSLRRLPTLASSFSTSTLAIVAALSLLAACTPDDKPPTSTSNGGQGGSGGQTGGGGQGGSAGGEVVAYPAVNAFDPTYDAYFDPPADGTYKDDYRVVGQIVPESWSWGKVELLEGLQRFRSEGYNLRTQKLRWQDTFQNAEYDLRTYFGALNQQIVDGFNIHYKSPCAGAVGKMDAAACDKQKGPTRAEARFVLLHHGPKTASLACDTKKTPVLLVHGAMQNGNVWISPGGNDGQGNAYPGVTQKTGYAQYLEEQGRCTYAVTFGTFHGDNFNHAIHVANAVRQVKQLTGASSVDVVAWSKGVLAVDVYLTETAKWNDWGTKHFEKVAADTAKNVPLFRKDIRTYVALSGPHLGIDLNFRHPFHNLVIYSTADSAPIGQGPVTWGWMSAVQCVTWGYVSSPSSIFPNPYAYSACENRGGTWPDYFKRIYTSNITGLDLQGQIVQKESLKNLNVAEGVDAATFDFDMYNHSLWGAVDDSGKYVSPYIGQLQAAYDLRSAHPLPNREDDPVSYDWSTLDTDEYKWRDWVSVYKLGYNPAGLPGTGGWVDDDPAHLACRTMAFDPAGSPCKAKHLYYDAAHAEGTFGGYTSYTLMDGIGIGAAMEIGGNFIERLRHHGVSRDLDFLYVVHGTGTGKPDAIFEIDGMDCPTCDPKGDGVLFAASIAAQDQLTQGFTADEKASKSKQDGLPYGHLDLGVEPAVWQKIQAVFDR